MSILDKILNNEDPKKPNTTQQTKQTILSSALEATKSSEHATDIQLGGYGIGNTSYDQNVTAENADKLEQIRGERQGWGAEAANAIGGGIAKIPFTVIGNIASALDFEDYYNTDNEVGNAVTAWAEEVKGDIEGATKIYKSNDNTLGSREWWMNNAKGLIDSAGGFVITGGILGKGVQLLSNLTKGSQVIQGIGTVTNAAMLNQAESIPIAMGVYEKSYEIESSKYKDQLDKGLITPEEVDNKARQAAADAAAYSININRINIPLNLTSTGAFLRPIAMTRQVAKDFSKKEVIGKLVSEGAQEYLEEDINMIAEKEALRRAKDGNKYTYDFDRTVSDVLSKEGFEQGIVGFLGGIVQTGGTDLLKSFQKGSPSYDEDGNVKLNIDGQPLLVTPHQSQKERFKAQQKSLNNIELLGKIEGVPTVKETLNKIKTTSTLLNDIQEAAISGDETTYNKLQNELLVNQSLDAFKNGTTEQLISLYKSVQKDPTSKDKFGDEYIMKSSEAIRQIEDLEKIYINHQSLPQINEVFSNRAEYSYTIKEADKLKRDISTAQADQLKEIEVTGFVKPNQIEKLASTKELNILNKKMNQLKEKAIVLGEEYDNLLSPEYTKKVEETKKEEPVKKEEEINKTFGVDAETEVVDGVNQPVEESNLTPELLGDKIINRAEGEEFTPEEQQYYNNYKKEIEAYILNKQMAGLGEYNPDEEPAVVEEVQPEVVNEVEVPQEEIVVEPTKVESKVSKEDPREIYPGLNNDGLRAKYKLPTGKEIRTIVDGYTKAGVDINTKISLRPFVTSAKTNSAIISLQTTQGDWIDLGNINSFTKDLLSSSIIDMLHSKNTSLKPNDLGIYFSMTEKVLDIVEKNEEQPSLAELDPSVKVDGDYLIYDRNNNYWANPNFDDSQLAVKPDFQAIQAFNASDLKNARYILLVPNGNKYSMVRLRAQEMTNESIDVLFDDLRATSFDFKADKELTAETIDNKNKELTGNLFISLNPEMKVKGKREKSYSLELKVGKFGKLQAEFSYKTPEGFKHITEYFNITQTQNMDELLAGVNKEFKEKHELDLNLKRGDLQQQVNLEDPSTFRAAAKPNVFRSNFGNQLVFNEMNIEEQPVVVQLAKIAEEDILNDNVKTAVAKPKQEEDDVDLEGLSDIQYSTGKTESTGISQSEIDHIKKLLPSFITIEDIDTIINNLNINGIPYGAFRSNIIYLNNYKGKPGTAYHEAFHAVFRTVLSDAEISKYLKIAKSEFKGDLKAAKALLLQTNPANSNLTETELEELVYEEYLADKFADYSKNKSDKSIGATLKQLFAKIINLFKGLFVNTDSSMVLFDKILDGAFANSVYQFNRFNGNNTAFKLLPRSYSKNDGLRFFTATKSRLLINTLTAKVHKAILNGDNKIKSEILESVITDRYNELEQDGFAYVDMLTAEGNTDLANKVSSEILDEQFILDPTSLKGQAQGLLKSEVLKRLELFSYVEKDIDSEEDKADGDDETLENNESDENEIKEQYGSKDAWLTGGHDSLSKTIKEYIAFTTYIKEDPLTGKLTEFAVDEVTLYNGMIRILSDTKESNMIDKLAIVAESNDNINAFLTRISKELGITKNEDGSFNTSNITAEAYNTFRLFVSNFKKSKASQLMTTYGAGDYKVFNANNNDPKKISRDQWSNALYYIKENNKLTNQQLNDFVKDANKSLVAGNNLNNLQYLTEENLSLQADQLKTNLEKVGISISKIYAKYSIVKAKEKAIVEYNEKNDIPIPFSQMLSANSIKILDLYNVTPITSDLLVGNNGVNLGSILKDGIDPYDTDKGINGRLEEIADANSYFDESIGNSSFTNAEGNRVYEIINLSYVLDKVNDLKSDTYWSRVESGQGLTEVESKNFNFIKSNYLLTNHKDALKRIELNIINGFRNENDKDGITFGSYDKRTYFGNALALFSTKTKGGLVRYIFRQNEASNTAYTATAPKINALNQKGGLSTEVKNAFYDKFLNEFNRITREYANKDDANKQIIKGYNDKLESGRAYKFAEFSYLAYINSALFNNLTRMAQEGNLDELKANENAVKGAIEYYLLQEGFGRFKAELERIGFIYNNGQSHFIPSSLVSEYGGASKALQDKINKEENPEVRNALIKEKAKKDKEAIDITLKEFYINDYLMSSSINELLDGDYALSRATKGFVKANVDGVVVEVPKNAYGIDISKRNKGGMASGPDYGNGEHTVSYIKDIDKYVVTKAVDGRLIRVTEVDGKFIGDDGKEYTENDVAKITTNDAQSYASQYHHIFGTMRLGRLDKKSFNIYKGLIQFTKRDTDGNIVKNISLDEKDQEYLEKSLASSNSKKTITFDGIAGIYHKLSEAGLWRSSISYVADEDVDTFVEYTDAIFELLKADKTSGKLFKDLTSELADLYKPIPGMEYLHNLANKMDKGGIDQVITESASKGATIKPMDSFDGDITLSSTKVRNNAKRLQTETPTGKDVITAGSQLINLIDTELNDEFEVPGFGTLGAIRETYRNLMTDSRENSFKQAMTYIKDIEGSNGEVDITKLRAKLVRSLEANNADESMLELFDKGYNLNLAAILDKAEQIVLAHFSKGVLNQKVNGTKVSLMSDAGIQVVRDENDNAIGIHEVLRNPSKHAGYKTSPLKYNVKTPTGERFSECMLSERIITKHGLKIGDTFTYEDIKNYPELLQAIGYRIPTQRHQSMMSLKVVGLLPNYFEGVGIFPMEIVYLSGADFDIDSEFIQLPQFWINKGLPVVYGTEKTIEDKWYGFKYYNVNYNKEFKSEYKKALKSGDKNDKSFKKLAYESVSKEFGLPIDLESFKDYKGESNAAVNNKSLRLMIAMLTNDYVQANSANEGTTTDPMAEVSNDINKLLAEGQANSKFKVPVDHVSASDINGKSTANAKNSAGKAGIGIVANKVQQLTLLLKANNGKGIGLRDVAFRWSIGGKQSNGYHEKFDGNSVMDIMGVLLNVMTDNAKDPIAGNMNLSLELLNGYTEFLAQGADKYNAALVLNQPSVQLYGDFKKIPNYTLASSDEGEVTVSKIMKAALGKLLYNDFSKATLDNIDSRIKEEYDIDINVVIPTNLGVKEMEEILRGKGSYDQKAYNTLQINALLQFTQLESQANDISNLNTYLKLNQGLDISFAELRRNLDKANEKLNVETNPKIHVDVLPLIKADALTYGNLRRAYAVLTKGEKIFIEQTKDFRRGLEKLYVSLNESYLNKKGIVKAISREFLGYVSTQAFKSYLTNIINTEKNSIKAEEAKNKLAGLNYSLVYPELGNTIVDQLTLLKNSDKEYIRNNSLVKYLRPSYKKENKKGIDFIDGKSFAKESSQTISLLLDGFKELMFDNDPQVKQFAINLLNYSIVKDNLQYKMGSIMKYISPGMFHTYSSVLDSMNKGFNTNNNELLQDFDKMGYNFRKLFVTYIANEKGVTLFKSIKPNVFTKVEANIVKFDAHTIIDDEKSMTQFENIFGKLTIVSVGGVEISRGYNFPQFYSFNGNVFELVEVDNQPHNVIKGVGFGFEAKYQKLEYHGNLSVSPYSFSTYEEAIAVDKEIKTHVEPKKKDNTNKVEKNDKLDLDVSDISGNFVDSKETQSDDFLSPKDLGLDENSTTDNFKC